MSAYNHVTAWEWPGGWELVRPLNFDRMRALLLEMKYASRFVAAGRADFATQSRRMDEVQKEVRLFLCGPTERPVLVLTLELAGFRSSELPVLSISPGNHKSRGFAQENEWWQAVCRIYGMADQLRSYFSVAEDEFPLAPISHGILEDLESQGNPVSRLGTRIGQSMRHRDAGSLLEALGPWLVPGAPTPEVEVSMLLGEPLLPFVAPTRDLVTS